MACGGLLAGRDGEGTSDCELQTSHRASQPGPCVSCRQSLLVIGSFPPAGRSCLFPSRLASLHLTSPHLTALHCTSLHTSQGLHHDPAVALSLTEINLSIARRSVTFFDHILTPLPVHLSPACSPSILQPYTPRMPSRAHLPPAGRS